MRQAIISGWILFLAALLARQIVQAQGTLYISNLGQTTTGSVAVASSAWEAAYFGTGANAGGYLLDSVQLGMADASGSPSGFIAMVYTMVGGIGADPGASLGTLVGSSNPSTSGIYTYSDDSDIVLAPNESYFIVLTAATASGTGAYGWGLASSYAYNPTGGWGVYSPIVSSSNGASWAGSLYKFPQFAVTATAIPEPGTLGLFVLGGLLFVGHRRKAKAA